MVLSKETVISAFREFAVVFGVPDHLKEKDRMARAIDIIHRELSKHYTEETFKDALTVAWQQARKFPCIADFHRGFDAPKRDDGPTLEELRIV